MPDTLSINQLAARIKERRPDLANVPDGTLVGKLLAAEPSLKPMVRMEYSDSRGGELKEPIRADQAAKFPSSQEQGQGGAGVQAPWYARFFPAMAEQFGNATSPIHSPLKTATALKEGFPQLAKDAFDFAGGTGPQMARLAKGEPLADPLGMGVVVEPALRGDFAEATGAATGMVTGGAAMGAAGKAAVRPPTGVEQSLFRKIKAIGSPGSPELNKWMNVTPKAMEHGANPAQQILADKLLGKTKAETVGNVKTALGKAGNEIETALYDATLQGAPKLNATPIIDNALNAVRKKIGTPKDATFQGNLDGIKADIIGEHPNLSALTPKQSQAVIKHLGDSINWHSAVENPINDAMIQIYGELRQAQAAQVPQLKPLLAKWQSLYVADKGLAGSMVKDAAGVGTGVKPPTPLSKAGTAIKENAGKAAGTALVGAAAYKLFQDAVGR